MVKYDMPVTRLEYFERWDYYSPIENRLVTVDASDTPFITYDNHIPCFEANMYMHQLLNAVRSRRIKGGTLRTYAHQIVHLVHYCYKNQITFSQLTDASFTMFVQGLQAERDKFGELVRSNNTVINIAHRCLEFLKFVQYCHDLKNFIGSGKENSIIVRTVKYKYSIEGSKRKKEVEGITHASVPKKDAVKKKLPVSEEDALKVWNFIQNQENREKRLRDIALYQCLEQLGARISEIHLITVSDIDNALKSGSNPHLVLTTLKRRDENATRSLPVSSTLLTDIKLYINKVRKKVIRRFKKSVKEQDSPALDHDFLFISLTTGLPLNSSTLTRYMNDWKEALGIKGELHPHLYRHAFITNKLKEIILKHKEITSADKFREHLLHTERFKLELQQWTGQTHLSSLDNYINLVFADLYGYTKTYNAIHLKESVGIVQRQIQQLKLQLKNKEITTVEGLLLIEDVLSAFESDINEALK